MYCLDKNEEIAEAWAWQERFPWPILMDVNAEVRNAGLPFKKYFQEEIPSYLLIDDKGKVRTFGTEPQILIEDAGLQRTNNFLIKVTVKVGDFEPEPIPKYHRCVPGFDGKEL